MCRKPVITAPAHSGMAILRFMDSWVVGVNVCGKRPRRFVDPINMIRETIIRFMFVLLVCGLALFV